MIFQKKIFINTIMQNNTENNTDTKSSSPQPVDFFGDCQAFAAIYCEKTGKKFTGKVRKDYITNMIMDELKELEEAKDEAEEVDALLDIVYYALDHLAKTNLDIRPIWRLIHNANMTKFGPGGYVNEQGKWCKPPNFIPPDDDIRREIAKQRLVKDK